MANAEELDMVDKDEKEDVKERTRPPITAMKRK